MPATGDEVVAQDVMGTVDVFRGVRGLGHGRALAPALAIGGDDPHKQCVAHRGLAQPGSERRHQRQAKSPQLDTGELHVDWRPC